MNLKILIFFPVFIFLLLFLTITIQGQNVRNYKKPLNINDFYWDNRFGDPAKGGKGVQMTGRIKAITKIGTNLYVGGNFRNIDGVEVNNLAMWDGVSWLAYGTSIFNSNIGITSIVGKGKDIFTAIFYNIVHWNGKQSLGGWSTVGPVNTMKYYKDNLIIAGSFLKIDTLEFKNIAKVVGNICFDLGGGVNSSVYTLDTDGNNLYAGGEFTKAGNISANKIAKWDGTSWSPLGDGFDDNVKSIAVSGNYVYAGGCFRYSGSTQVNRIAVWDGYKWSPLGKGFNNDVLSIGVLNNQLYAVGLFTTVDDKPIKYIAKWNGTKWSDVGGGINGTANIISVIDSNIYIAGKFDSAGNMQAYNIARWDGKTWYPILKNRLTSPGIIENITVSGNDVYAGGLFDMVGNEKVNNIARWDGNEWHRLGLGIDPYGEVNSIAIEGKNIYAGGIFEYAGGNRAKNVAKWDGEKWSSLSSGIDEGYVSTIASKGNNVYVGGYFKRAGERDVNCIAKWDGENWSPLGDGINNPVLCITSDSNYIYAGGVFDKAGNKSINLLAKWDGQSWSGIGSEFSSFNLSGGEICSIVIDKNNIIAGGRLYFSGNSIEYQLAKWDGNSWSTPWSKVSDNPIKSIAIKDTDIYVIASLDNFSGYFDRVGIWSVDHWVKVFDISLDPGIYLNSFAFYGNDLYIGGYFKRLPNGLIEPTESFGIGCWRNRTTSVENEEEPTHYKLYQNYPNPFNPSTAINYKLPINSFVTLKIYDILGREITSLINEKQTAGMHNITWEPKSIPAGVYFYKLQTEKYSEVKKMVYIK